MADSVPGLKSVDLLEWPEHNIELRKLGEALKCYAENMILEMQHVSQAPCIIILYIKKYRVRLSLQK